MRLVYNFLLIAIFSFASDKALLANFRIDGWIENGVSVSFEFLRRVQEKIPADQRAAVSPFFLHSRMPPIQQAFLKAVYDAPERDDVRSAYADYLIEQGQEDAGNFIKHQLWSTGFPKEKNWRTQVNMALDLAQKNPTWFLPLLRRLDEATDNDRSVSRAADVHEIILYRGFPFGFRPRESDNRAAESIFIYNQELSNITRFFLSKLELPIVALDISEIDNRFSERTQSVARIFARLKPEQVRVEAWQLERWTSNNPMAGVHALISSATSLSLTFRGTNHGSSERNFFSRVEFDAKFSSSLKELMISDFTSVLLLDDLFRFESFTGLEALHLRGANVESSVDFTARFSRA